MRRTYGALAPSPVVDRGFTILLAVCAWVLLSIVGFATAQTEPITSSGLNTVVTTNGNVHDIAGGTRPGGGANLFHSFGDFGVPANNIANFLNAGSVDLAGNPLAAGLPTSNILGRVTGGNVSNIFGAIQTTNFGNANLFLMNPAGFLFGPNATVNVGGLVAFTSADYLKLTDNARFNAIPDAAADALLTALPVASFGFLGSNPGAITVQGSQFTVTDGQSISLVGGNISIESGTPDGGTTQPARLSAPNGKIQLASTASPWEFDAATLQPLPNVDDASFISFGSVTLAPGSSIDVNGTNTVSIRGGQFVLSVNDAVLTTAENGGQPEAISLSLGSSIVTSNSGTDPGADVQFIASIVQMDGASIKSTTVGDGPGGNISIIGQTVGLTNGAQIISLANGQGAAGEVNIYANNAITISGTDTTGQVPGYLNEIGLVATGIFSDSPGGGTPGSVSIISPHITVSEGGRIHSATSSDANGAAITLTTGTLEVNSGGGILTTSGIDFQSFELRGNGKAGDINITASDSISVAGLDSLGIASAIQSLPLGIGAGGSIRITTPSVSLNEQGTINTFSFGEGPAGDISLDTHSLTIAGGGGIVTAGSELASSGSILISAQENVSVTGTAPDGTPSRIVNENGGSGGTGFLTIDAKDLLVSNGARIRSDTFLSPQLSSDPKLVIHATDSITLTGNQSDITVMNFLSDVGGMELATRTFTMTGQSTVSTLTVADGNGGPLTITAENLNLSGGSQITSASQGGSGHAGTIQIQGPQSPADSLTIDGPGSGIFTTTSGTGAGGDIFVNANSVTLQNGGTLSAETTGTEVTAIGGNITVHADQIALQSGAVITSGTSGAGDGGTVTLSANESISLANSTVASNSEPAPGASIVGNGGQLNLSAPSITLEQGSALLAQTTGSGHAGAIELNANNLSLADMSVVQTSTFGPGPAGSITVQGLAGSGTKAETVSLVGGSSLLSSSVGNDEGEGGAAGNILVEIQTLSLSGGSQITTSSIFSPGDAGTITINAGKEVQLSQGILTSRSESNIPDEFVNDYVIGNAGSIIVSAPTVTLKNHSLIASTTDSRYTGDPSKGNAGSVTVNTTNLSLTEGSQLTSSSIIGDSGQPPVGNAGSVTVQGLASPAQSVLIDGASSGIFTDTQGTGAGGSIFVNANSVTLQNGGTLSAKTSGTSSAATGGTIMVEANQVQLNNAGLITASTTGAGAGGSINIGTGTFASNASTVSSTAAQAQGGNIAITAGQAATLNNGSSISASSSGLGNAGNIQINAGNQFTMTNSSVTTEANQASGGAIKITTAPSGTVQLTNSLISASVLDGTGGGGSVNIDPQYVIMQNSQILAQAVQGPGGNITINITNGGLFLPDANSTVSASSKFGVNGTVTIQSPNAPASGKIQPLGKSPLQATSLLNQRCAALAGGEFSSFTVAGRDSLPTEPGSWLASPLYAAGVGEGQGVRGEGLEGATPILSLRQIAPTGFLTQAFAVDWSAGCGS